jgi:hypothetical protein
MRSIEEEIGKEIGEGIGKENGDSPLVMLKATCSRQTRGLSPFSFQLSFPIPSPISSSMLLITALSAESIWGTDAA